MGQKSVLFFFKGIGRASNQNLSLEPHVFPAGYSMKSPGHSCQFCTIPAKTLGASVCGFRESSHPCCYRGTFPSRLEGESLIDSSVSTPRGEKEAHWAHKLGKTTKRLTFEQHWSLPDSSYTTSYLILTTCEIWLR